MKKILITLTLITITLINTHAQTNAAKNNAAWVVESNENTPKVQTVNFYDNEQQLIYSETINTRLNISRRKVQKALNRILDSLLAGQEYGNNKNVLAASFKLKQ